MKKNCKKKNKSKKTYNRKIKKKGNKLYVN